MRVFEGVDSDIVKLQSNLMFLVFFSFWFTHETPMCIDD